MLGHGHALATTPIAAVPPVVLETPGGGVSTPGTTITFLRPSAEIPRIEQPEVVDDKKAKLEAETLALLMLLH